MELRIQVEGTKGILERRREKTRQQVEHKMLYFKSIKDTKKYKENV